MMRYLMTGVAIGAVFLTAACGGSQSFALNGQVVLASNSIEVGQEGGQNACKGAGGYTDIIGGEDVIVSNESGEELARTQLELGQPTDGGQSCVFPFTIPELPEANQYAIAIGNQSRPPATYTLDELRQDDFNISLALGD